MAAEDKLTIRLLVSCSGSWTTKLLGLIPPGVSNKERSIELNQDVLYLLLALLVNILLVVSYQRLRKGLSDCVHLGCVSTTLHANADVNVSKPK